MITIIMLILAATGQFNELATIQIIGIVLIGFIIDNILAALLSD